MRWHDWVLWGSWLAIGALAVRISVGSAGMSVLQEIAEFWPHYLMIVPLGGVVAWVMVKQERVFMGKRRYQDGDHIPTNWHEIGYPVYELVRGTVSDDEFRQAVAQEYAKDEQPVPVFDQIEFKLARWNPCRDEVGDHRVCLEFVDEKAPGVFRVTVGWVREVEDGQ